METLSCSNPEEEVKILKMQNGLLDGGPSVLAMVDENGVFNPMREVEDDGDVACGKGEPSNGKWGVGRDNVQSAKFEGDNASGRGGSRLKFAGKHLMLERTGQLDRSEGFESKVEDSNKGVEKSGMDLSAHCLNGPHPNSLGLSKDVSVGHLLSQIGLGKSFNPEKELVPLCQISSDNIESSSEIRAINLGDDCELAGDVSNIGVVDQRGAIANN